MTVPEYLTYLENYPSQHSLLPERATVDRVERARDGFRVAFLDGGEGVFRAVVVGGATSAVEIAEECARAGRGVTVSAPGGRVRLMPTRFLGRDVHDFFVVLERLPRWVLGWYLCGWRPTNPGGDQGFTDFVRRGDICVRGRAVRFDGPRAHFEEGGSGDFDTVVLATGFRYALPFVPPEVERTRAGLPATRAGQSTSWPGLFFVGAPCSRGIDSEFLRGVARDAPVVAGDIQRLLG